MRKLLTLTLIAFAVTAQTVPVEAATPTQKAALKAEKKARADALKAQKVATALNAKAAKEEAKVAKAVARVVAVRGPAAAAAIPTPEEFVAVFIDDDLEEANEKAAWLTMTPEERAIAMAAYKAAEKAEDDAEKAYVATLTSPEKAAYYAAKKAAEALEDASEAASDADDATEYANMTIAERIAYNDDLEADEAEFEDELVGLTPEEIAIAIAAHQAREAAEHAAEYAAWMALTPEERAALLAAGFELDDDVDDAEEIEIEDGEDFD